MTTQPAASTRGSGLQTAIDIIVSPTTAFDRLREMPTWGWALLVGSVLGAAGSLLLAPAIAHAIDASLPAQLAALPAIAKLPPEVQEKAIHDQIAFQHILGSFLWIVTPLLLMFVALLQAVTMLFAKAVTKSAGSFRHYWALALNVQVIGAVGTLVLGVIALVRGPATFMQPSELQAALPNLGMIVPGASRVVLAALTAINVFAIWQTVIIALGMQRAAGLPRVAAWSVASFFLLALVAAAAFGAAATPAPAAS